MVISLRKDKLINCISNIKNSTEINIDLHAHAQLESKTKTYVNCQLKITLNHFLCKCVSKNFGLASMWNNSTCIYYIPCRSNVTDNHYLFTQAFDCFL